MQDSVSTLFQGVTHTLHINEAAIKSFEQISENPALFRRFLGVNNHNFGMNGRVDLNDYPQTEKAIGILEDFSKFNPQTQALTVKAFTSPEFTKMIARTLKYNSRILTAIGNLPKELQAEAFKSPESFTRSCHKRAYAGRAGRKCVRLRTH
jgi:hypothetical protein